MLGFMEKILNGQPILNALLEMYGLEVMGHQQQLGGYQNKVAREICGGGGIGGTEVGKASAQN